MARRNSSRRDFLKQSAAASVGFWVAGGVSLSADKEKSPLERVNFAGIGIGGKGSSDIDNAGDLGDVVALCDIDDDFLNAKASRFKDAQKFNDFREMLEKMGDKIDAVTVSTPDHTHAPASRDGHEDEEARLLPEAADARRLRGPPDARDRQGNGRLHADGQPGHGRERSARGRRDRAGRRHRQGDRGPRLDQPADLAASPPHHGTAEGRRPGAEGTSLGPVPGHGPGTSLPSWRRQGQARHLSRLQLARLVGLRHRRPRRHGLPHGQHGLHGSQARPSDLDLRRVRRTEPRDVSGLGPGRLSSSRPATTCRPSSSPGTRAARTASWCRPRRNCRRRC